jgi:hypothetical protein
VAALAFLCIIAPFGAIFAVDGGSCCSSMKRGTCPMQRRVHDACKSPLTHCRAHANENAGQAVVDFHLTAFERPLTESSSALIVPPSFASTITGCSRIVPRSLKPPPELPPPREQRAA